MELTLRPYQQDLFRQLCLETGDVLMELPTGSGKTLLIITLIAQLLEDSSITHAIIAAPQRQIESGFVDHRITRADCGDRWVSLGGKRVRKPSERGRSKSAAVYCRTDAPGYAIALTHQAMTHLAPSDLPDDLSTQLLVIDEAHHAPAAGLGKLISAWRERKGRLLFSTATPYRADWQPVRLDGMKVIRRSLAEHMEDNDGAYAPRVLQSEIIGLDVTENVTPAMFNGEESLPTSSQEVLADQMVSQWESEHRPKTIVKVPPLKGGTRQLIQHLVKAFKARGAKVLDATGIGRAKQQHIIEALQQDRAAPYEMQLDVVVGIERVKEGTDWPACTHVLVIGFPRSLQMVVQLIGRATRKKPDHYPPLHRNRAKIMFFVPTSNGRGLENLSLDHSRHALFVASFLADAQTGQQWLAEREIRRGALELLSDAKATDQDITSAQREVYLPLDHQAHSLVNLIAVDVIEDMRKHQRELQTKEVLCAIQQHPLAEQIPPQDRDRTIRHVLAQVLMSEPDTGPRARAAFRTNLQQEARRFPCSAPAKVSKLVEAALEKVLEDFRDETITQPGQFECFRQQLHQLTGGKMKEFARRLQNAIASPITLEEVREEIWSFFQRTGKWPTTESGAVERFGCTWAVLNNNLVHGYRELPGSSSLSREVEQTKCIHELPVADRSSLTLERIDLAIEQFYRDRGCFPSLTTDEIVSGLGIKWRSVDIYCRSGGRGLKGGASLGERVTMVQQRLGVLPKTVTLSLGQVRCGILAHFERTGKWPGVSSGQIEELGIQAKTLNTRLAEGKAGLPGGSSLAQEVAHVKAALGIETVPVQDLTVVAVHHAITVYHRAHGEWPRAGSGLSELGITFHTLNKYLKQGGRGLQGGSSLAKEVKQVSTHMAEGMPAP